MGDRITQHQSLSRFPVIYLPSVIQLGNLPYGIEVERSSSSRATYYSNAREEGVELFLQLQYGSTASLASSPSKIYSKTLNSSLLMEFP